MMCLEVIGLAVLPSIAQSAPDYINDVLAVATGGLPRPATSASWQPSASRPASATCSAAWSSASPSSAPASSPAGPRPCWPWSTVAVLAIPLLPQVNQRLFAIPNAVALIGLGYSLWREQRTSAPQTTPSIVGPQLDPIGAK